MALRNEELHTGSLVLAELKSSRWQPQYYELAAVLLKSLDLDLEDFFSEVRATAVKAILTSVTSKTKTAVLDRVATAREFEQLSEAEQSVAEQRQPTEREREVALARLRRQQVVECPSCSSRVLISGEIAGRSTPQVGEEGITWDVRVLPTHLHCEVCGLDLQGHDELHHAEVGDEYVVADSEDPLEYYGIDARDLVSIEDLIDEPEYGND